MAAEIVTHGKQPAQPSPLAAPSVNGEFDMALDDLVTLAKAGHQRNSDFFNPPDEWLVEHMSIFQDLPKQRRDELLAEAESVGKQAKQAKSSGLAASRAWPEVVVRLDGGGLAFFSQLGVARRPDLTQYFVDGFT
ncbi:MAG: hypothetical protein ACE5Q6_10905, partial [Dehalococcoidia bacterium]